MDIISTLRIWLLLLWAPRIIRGIIIPPSWANFNLNPCAQISWQLLQWPSDKQCYTIFKQGPCGEQEELYFSEKHSEAKCRCAQGTVKHKYTNKCYRHYSRGPCDKASYISSLNKWDSENGVCHPYKKCEIGHIFWPQTQECYSNMKQGPCAYGELLFINNKTGEPQCSCNPEVMPEHFWTHDATCHEHDTVGPCIEGQIFKYNSDRRKTECVCGSHLTRNYHAPTNRCYPQGSIGPCGRGQLFMYNDKAQKATCQCLKGHVKWLLDGNCYREYTKGPCSNDNFLRTIGNSNHGSCVRNFCLQGQLYDPLTDKCYYVGRKGPCDIGKLWVFEKASSVKGTCKCDKHLIGYWKPQKICYEIGEQGPCEKRKVIEYNRSTGQVECKCNYRRGYISWIPGGCLRVGVSKRRVIPVSGSSINSVRNKFRIHRGLTLPFNNNTQHKITCNNLNASCTTNIHFHRPRAHIQPNPRTILKTTSSTRVTISTHE